MSFLWKREGRFIAEFLPYRSGKRMIISFDGSNNSLRSTRGSRGGSIQPYALLISSSRWERALSCHAKEAIVDYPCDATFRLFDQYEGAG